MLGLAVAFTPGTIARHLQIRNPKLKKGEHHDTN